MGDPVHISQALKDEIEELAKRAIAAIGDDEIAAYDRDRDRDRRMERMRDAGVLDVLPPAMVAHVACDQLARSEALGLVQRWAAYQASSDRKRGDKPIFALIGDMGRGKTVAAAWLLAREGGLYVEGEELVRLHSAQWGDERKRFERLVRAGALVIDELGKDLDARGALRDVINRRQGRRLTLLLGNLSKADLRTLVDPRTWDRMRACAVVAELTGESMRKGTL